MTRRIFIIGLFALATSHTLVAQQGGRGSALRSVSRTMYTSQTELFAEFTPPLVVGQPTRLTAHLTKVGDRFRPYTEGKVRMTLTVEGTTLEVNADGPEREGVFRLPTTPTKAGTGRMVIELLSLQPPERFVLEDVTIYPDAETALAKQSPAETGLISYAKESSWAADFATAPAGLASFGPAHAVVVPAAALVREGERTRVYVQHTPERFELRSVTTGRAAGDLVEIATGLREGERIVVVGADKIPRQSP